MIGIDASTLTKIINGSQGTRKRDLIIALCFALQLSESETTLALNFLSQMKQKMKQMKNQMLFVLIWGQNQHHEKDSQANGVVLNDDKPFLVSLSGQNANIHCRSKHHILYNV